jgi:POT family proton-dependent oligopeptide transporter
LTTTDAGATPVPNEEEWFGHPKGLFYLFFAEMWERFCFYGMRNILVLYMTYHFLFNDEYAQGGVYAAYMSLVYCMAILGGYMADKFLGYRRSIIFGGIVMAAGMIMLLFNRELLGYIGIPLSEAMEKFFFFAGMATIIIGNGYFKPNISAIVGRLYKPGDRRRDAGFTIFYMGINVGAFSGGLLCGYLGQQVSWPLGFGVAALGMILGVAVFGSRGATRHLHGHGDAPDPERMRRSFPWIMIGSFLGIPFIYYFLQHGEIVGWLLGATALVVFGSFIWVAIREDKVQREQIFALLVLVLFNPIFWAFFEQAGSSLTLYADRNLDRSVFGWEMPSSWPQNFNALFIITLAPVFAWLWMWLGNKGREPSIPMKFTLGLFQLGLGFLALVIGGLYFAKDGITPLGFMVLLYLLLTWGELCLSPVGLSMITKLAPQRLTGMAMGAWFLSLAGAQWFGGQIAALTGAAGGEAGGEALPPPESLEIYTGVYQNSALFVFGAAVLLLLLVPLLRKWTHGVQ